METEKVFKKLRKEKKEIILTERGKPLALLIPVASQEDLDAQHTPNFCKTT
jgi:prevent-host-death family protein